MVNIEIPLALMNKNTIKPDYLIVYSWLRYFCIHENDEWDIDYTVLSQMTGYNTKQLSLAIKNLEINNLLEVKRSKGKIKVIMCYELPDNIRNAFIKNWTNAVIDKSIKEVGKEFTTAAEQILEA